MSLLCWPKLWAEAELQTDTFKYWCIFIFYLQGRKHEHLLLGAVYLLQQDGPASLFVQLGYSNCVVLEQKQLIISPSWQSGLGAALKVSVRRVTFGFRSKKTLYLKRSNSLSWCWTSCSIRERDESNHLSITAACSTQGEHPTLMLLLWELWESFFIPWTVDGFVHQWERLVQLGQLSRRQVWLALGCSSKVETNKQHCFDAFCLC